RTAAGAPHRPAVHRLQGPLRDGARPAARARTAHARGARVLGRGGRPRLRRGEPHVLPRQERRAGPGRAARASRGGCAAAPGARAVRPGDRRCVAAARGGHVRDRVQAGRAGMAGAVVSSRGDARRRLRAGARRAAWRPWAGRVARVRPARQARRRPLGPEGARRHAPRRLHAGLRGSESGPRPPAAGRRRFRHAPQRRALQPGRPGAPGARCARAALSQCAAATRGAGGAAAHAALRGPAVRIDPTLERTVESARNAALSGAQTIEKKLVASLKRLEGETLIRQIARARAAVYPQGHPQERVLTLASFSIRYGPALLDALEQEVARWAGASYNALMWVLLVVLLVALMIPFT